VIADRLRRFFSPPADLNKTRARWLPNAINASTSQLRLIRHVEQPVLKARGAKICDENFHG
jgi:hypothetical protein